MEGTEKRRRKEREKGEDEGKVFRTPEVDLDI